MFLEKLSSSDDFSTSCHPIPSPSCCGLSYTFLSLPFSHCVFLSSLLDQGLYHLTLMAPHTVWHFPADINVVSFFPGE